MNDSILLIMSKNTKSTAMGTGFVIHNDEGSSYILTCNHVLESVKEPKIDDYEIEVIAQSELYDMALLRVNGLSEKPFILKEQSNLNETDVSLIGYRKFTTNDVFRLNQKDATILNNGRHKNNNNYFDVWEIKAKDNNKILKGYSGSPLIFNDKVIGIMSNRETQDIGFAVNIKYLANIWEGMPKDLLLKEKGENPFVGLSPFTQETKAFFFGRDKEIKEISSRLEQSSFLAVVGDSGSGKSSIIKAGMIPYYLENDAYILELRPANNPYIELSNQLKKQINSEKDEQLLFELHAFCEHSKTTLLIYIDQFEELFTLTSKDIRETFLETLLYLYRNNLDSKLKIDIIFTMRSDYFPQLQQYEQFYKLIMDEDGINQVLIKSMDKKQLKETIVKPLLKVELVHEVEANSFADLVILNMGNRANEVTLLQNALTIIWHETKQGKTLVEAYKDVGGIAGALPTLANETIEAISTKENKDIQAIFLRLLKYAKKGNHTRRIAEKSEFSVKQWELVQLLSSALNSQGERAIQDDEKLGRLLKLSGKSNANEQSVELIHETLITSWMTYSNWVQEFGLYKVTHDVVIEKSKEYNKHQEEKDFLLMGVDLSKGIQLLESDYRKFLSEDEDLYVFESKRFREEKVYKKERMIKQLRGAVVILIGLVGLSGYFWFEANKKNEKMITVLGKSTYNAVIVVQTNKPYLARFTFNHVLNDFKNSQDIRIQKIVAQAWFGKATTLEKIEKYEEAIHEYTNLISFFEKSREDYILKYVVKALYNKAKNLSFLKKNQKSMDTYYKLITDFEDSSNKSLLEYVLKAETSFQKLKKGGN